MTMAFHIVRTRIHLIPPLVLPAQAPTIVIKATNIQVEGCHSMKSSVVNPVVDCMAMVWNVLSRMAVSHVHEVEHKSPHYGHTNEDEQEAAQFAVLPSVLPAAFDDGQI